MWRPGSHDQIYSSEQTEKEAEYIFFLQVIKDKKYKNHSWQQTNANRTGFYSKSQLKQISEVLTQENKHAKQTGAVYFISFINHLNISKQGKEKLA